ncbi:MAG: sigma-70 family RNA polymerase sigma factor [Clostridiales bacterium]|nr:sigma-70 family RNA polymerase sigma factor [Clostridiales bacterium]
MNIEGIFNSYYDKVCSFTMLRVGHVHDAEDIACSVFVKVAEKLDTYDSDKAAFSTWIFTITLNEIRMYFRARKTECTLDDIAELADRFDIEEDLLRKEEYALLCEAIGRLNENQKNAVLLKYFGGLTNIRIAEVMGLRESNVGFILHRAKKIIRKSLISSKESDAAAYKNIRKEGDVK